MDIDYTAIIEKANARTDILKEIQAELETTPEIIDHISASVDWLRKLGALYLRLDDEGKKMIPAPQRTGLNAANYAAANYGRDMLQVLRNLCGVQQ